MGVIFDIDPNYSQQKKEGEMVENFVPTLPREIVPPPKKNPPIISPPGTISRGSRGQPLLSLLHTKTATPLQYEKLSTPPRFFPQGGQFHGESYKTIFAISQRTAMLIVIKKYLQRFFFVHLLFVLPRRPRWFFIFPPRKKKDLFVLTVHSVTLNCFICHLYLPFWWILLAPSNTFLFRCQFSHSIVNNA